MSFIKYMVIVTIVLLAYILVGRQFGMGEASMGEAMTWFGYGVLCSTIPRYVKKEQIGDKESKKILGEDFVNTYKGQ